MGINGKRREIFIYRFLAMAINVIYDANDRKGSKMTPTMSFVLDMNHCYHTPTKIEKGVAIDPTCIIIGRLERTEPNLIPFNWGNRVKSSE